MGRWFSVLIFCRIFGWKVTGFRAPVALQHVAIAVPHTSNWDFFLGVYSRSVHRITHVKYIGKSSLFVFPFGYLFRALGGYPVVRHKNTNFVQSIVDIFKKDPTFSVCLSPEGTRTYTNKLKTGFYYIAQQANVPLIFVKFDYSIKTVDFSEPYYLTNDFDTDIKHILDYFRGTKGHNYTFEMDYPWKED